MLLRPVLHLPLLVLHFLRKVLLENVRLEDPFFEDLVLEHELLDDTVTEAELIDTVLEVFLLHGIAGGVSASTSHSEVPLTSHFHDLLHAKNFILSQIVQLNRLSFLHLLQIWLRLCQVWSLKQTTCIAFGGVLRIGLASKHLGNFLVSVT